MSLMRRDPFREMVTLRDAMDRLFDESVLRPWWSQEGEQQGVFVPMDLRETDDQFVVSAPLPGLKPEDVDITISGNTLTIKGEFREESEDEDGQVRYRERRYGAFQRSMTLPEGVDATKAEAEFENGLLKLQLPKAEEVKPRQIEIKAK